MPPSAIPDPADFLDAAEERAAIMEHDGGLSRTEAERRVIEACEPPALACLLRERWGCAS